MDLKKYNVTNRFINVYHFFKKIRVPGKVTFIIIGILSTVWFLIRVIPKPSRAGYPCMKASAPFMSSFIIYLLSISGSFLAFKKSKALFSKAKYISAFALLFAGLVAGIISLTSNSTTSEAQGFDEQEFEANEPMGTGQGIFPGRVVWAWDPDATNEKCTNTNSEDNPDGYFLPKNNNQEVIDRLVSDAILKLAGQDEMASAIDAIFRHFNTKKGKGDVGYTEGETIYIKMNQGTGGWMSDDSDLSLATGGWRDNYYGVAETAPATVMSVLRILVNDYGVRQEDIFLGDPIAHIFKHTYEYLHAEFPDIKYIDKEDYGHLGRYKLTVPDEPVIFWSDKGEDMPEAKSDKLYKEVQEADYLINLAALKAHARAGVTLCAKNHFGTHTRGSAAHLHPGLVAPENDVAIRTEYGMYRVLVDIIGHEKLGGNTVLFLVDGLWSGVEATDKPIKWEMAPFNGDWPSSIFVSQDQVALESVCFDFLRTEFNEKNHPAKARPHMGAVDDYLEQAADKSNWPDGIVYDPEGDGTPITSLGVHEHWNNPIEKQYSINLGNSSGIELVSIPESLVENENKQDDGEKVVAKKASTIPTIDGNTEDDCWKATDWIPIDQTWITWGETIPLDDFQGMFKVSWSPETNLLYYIVKVTDDAFVSGYQYPDGGYPNFDIVEIFIDEDKSGGLHVFDGTGNTATKWGENAENAFSYHIVPDEEPEDGGIVNDKVVCDIGGTNWGAAQTIPDYASHFPDFAITKSGNTYYWEFSMKVYADTYDDANPEDSRVELTLGKEMGMTVAYCDNDKNDNERDNFFGSVWVPEERYNDHWKNADDYGTLVLEEAGEAINHAPVVEKNVDNITLNQRGTNEIIVEDIAAHFSDKDGDELTYSFWTESDVLQIDIVDNNLQLNVDETFSGNVDILLSATDPDQKKVTISFSLEYQNKEPEFIKEFEDMEVSSNDTTFIAVEDMYEYVNDPDNASLSFDVDVSETTVQAKIKNGKQLEITLGDGFDSSVNITLTATDGEFTISDELTIEYVEQSSGILDFSGNKSFVCYPNPVSNKEILTVRLNNKLFKGETFAEIYNFEGKRLFQKQMSKQKGIINENLDLSGINAGTYILRVSCHENYESAIIVVK
jgi:hypothetical protein